MKQLKALSILACTFVLLVFLNATASAQTGLSLTGQLTNDYGEPLPGQAVSLNGPTGGWVTTDTDGRYAFSVWPGTYSLSISNGPYDSSVHSAMGYTLYTSSFDVNEDTTLNLQIPFKKLTVHVRDSQGAAIPNVGIETSSAWLSNLAIGSLPTGALFASGNSYYSYNPPSAVFTHADGDVDLWLLPTPSDPMSCPMQPCTYSLFAHPPSDSLFSVTALSDVMLTQDSSVTISLSPAISLTGTVTNDRGEGLPGQGLYLAGATGNQATTDANGHYAFSVGAGTYNLSIGNGSNSSSIHAPMSYSLNSSSFALTQNMTLDLSLPFQQVNVHVVDTSEQPVAGVGLGVNGPWLSGLTLGGLSFSGSNSYWYDPYMFPNSVATDASGNATLWLLPVSDPMLGGYTITATPPVGSSLLATMASNILVTGETNVNIKFSSPVTLSGRLTDADGSGLPSQSVLLSGPVSFSGMTDGGGYYAVSANPGNYTVQISGSSPAGSTAHIAQYYSLQSAGYINLTQNMTLDLSLPFQRVNVHAVDANEQPVIGAGLSTNGVWLSGLTFGGLSFSGSSSYWYEPYMSPNSVATGANGNATLWLLPVGDPMLGGYTLTAYGPVGSGLTPVELYNVLVPGETNITFRFSGVPQPPPVITNVSPDLITANGPGLTLTVNGTGFINGSTVQWNGAGRATTFVSGTLLTAAIPAFDLVTYGGTVTAAVTVVNPNGGATSNSVTVTIVTPPVISSTTPTFLLANGLDQSLTVNGSWFVNGSVVRWNGSPRETTFQSPWVLQARILGSDLAAGGVTTATVTVVNPNGGGISNPASVSIAPFTDVVLSGRVTDAQGTGLANQSIGLSGPLWLGGMTDDTGHYTISASTGTYGLQVSGGVPVSSTLHAPQSYNLSTPSIALIQNTTLDLSLPFQRVNVHVVDANEHPVSSAGLGTNMPWAYGLTLGSLSFSGYSSYSYWFDPMMGSSGVTTDASGNATLWLLPVSDPMMGSYTFTAYAPPETGLPPAVLSNVVVTGETNVTIRFATPVTLSGRITDAASNGLPNQTVTLYGPVSFSGWTDTTGHYAISAGPGNYSLTLSGGAPISSTLQVPQSYNLSAYEPIALTQNTTLDLSLPFQRVNVHVVDASEQSMAGVRLGTDALWIYGLTFGGLSFSGSSNYGDYYPGGAKMTDASGNATLWLLPSAGSMSGQGYTFTAYAPAETGLPPAVLSNVVVTGETNVTIRFAPPVILSGRITDAAGNALVNQSITLSGPVSLSGMTDSSGHYAISASPGNYSLQLSGGAPMSSTLQVPQNYNLSANDRIALTQNMTVDLSLSFQRVNVHVVDANDQPVIGAGLATSNVWTYGLTMGGRSFSGSSNYWYDSYLGGGNTTDASGNATLWLLPVSDPMTGSYTFTAYAPAETGLPPASLSDVLVTGETNVTIRFTGSLPGNAPVISSISPTSVAAMSPSFTLVVTGTNFVNSSVVRWDGNDLVTRFIDSTSLNATIPPTRTAAAGTASITVFTPPPGGGTSNSVILTIEKAATASTVASSAPASVYGQPITITATVTSTVGAPGGSVSFKEGTTTLASGVLTGGAATYVTSTLAVGLHPITVEYGGDANHSASISQVLNQTVDKAKTTLALMGSSGPVIVGQPVTVTLALAVTAPGSGSPTGTIVVSDGGVSCTATLPSASCPIVFSASGSKSLVATYAGDTNFSSSTSPSMTLAVNNPVPVLTALSPSSAKAGDAGFSLTVTGSNLSNESVVRWNGSPFTTTFKSPTTLKVDVPAATIATPGAGYVTVFNPAPGGGESNVHVLLTTDTGTAVTASSVGTSTTSTGTATATITRAGDQPSLTATAYGRGMISVAQYAANPGGAPSFNSDGAFVDVHVAPNSAFTSLTVVDCILNGGNVVYWWNGIAWTLASDQTYNAATGCITVTVNDTTAPNLYDFTGTYLASSTDRTAPTVNAKGTMSTGDYTFGQWVTQTVQVTLTAQDNAGGTGVKKIVYSANGAQSIPMTEVLNSTATINLTAEGETQVTYYALDKADNRATDQTVAVKIDKTLPTVGTCPVAGPFLLNSGLQPVGPIVVSDVPAGIDAASSQLTASVDTGSLGGKTVTLVAKDLAGNSRSATCNYTVIPSATINVLAALHNVGAGTTPGVQKAALAVSLKIFDGATIPSAEQKDYATVWNSGPGLASPSALISGPSATKFGGGQANLYSVLVPASDSANKVTSGRYLVIGKVEGAEAYVGAATDSLAANSMTQEYLQVIQKSDGDRVPAVTITVPGSLLLIVEPAYLEFTSDTELFPIIYDSVDGTWEAMVKTDPPQGFVSTPGTLSVGVNTGQLAAVQFTVKDIGSQWTTTKVTNQIKHNGMNRTVTSSVAMVNRQPATTKTPTPTVTRTATPTPTGPATATRTLTQTMTPTSTATATALATQTSTPIPTGTSTVTVASKTSTATPTATPTQTVRAPGTVTPKKSPTATPMATATSSRTATSTSTAVRTKTATASPTAKPTQTPVPKATATPKKSPTATPTRGSSPVPTKGSVMTPTLARTPTLTATPKLIPGKH